MSCTSMEFPGSEIHACCTRCLEIIAEKRGQVWRAEYANYQKPGWFSRGYQGSLEDFKSEYETLHRWNLSPDFLYWEAEQAATKMLRFISSHPSEATMTVAMDDYDPILMVLKQ